MIELDCRVTSVFAMRVKVVWVCGFQLSCVDDRVTAVSGNELYGSTIREVMQLRT
jgi:hypothetical protein